MAQSKVAQAMEWCPQGCPGVSWVGYLHSLEDVLKLGKRWIEIKEKMHWNKEKEGKI